MTETKVCPYCAEEIRGEAVKCRFCGSRLDRNPMLHEWRRSERGRILGGVCAGLAEQFDISVTVVRLAFLLTVLLGFGTGILIYAILWVAMPLDEGSFGETRYASDVAELPDPSGADASSTSASRTFPEPPKPPYAS
jgi:phage shock protein PspC (stress-responsive transcriptional regulator)